jgi:hypothetical protein
MANTFKFGNGQWAVKDGYALAYNDENGNFKPLPFDFTRSTSATRVNKDGLIEVVTNNKPRIDFLNDSNGALLLEPSRSNINTFSDPTDAQKGSTSYASVTYQDDFNWGLGNVINNAIVFGDNSTTRYAYYNSTVVSGTEYTLSFFIKMDDNSVPIPATDFLLVLAGTSIASGYTIDNYGNNVYRVSVSGTAGASNTANGILKVASHSAKTFKITGFQIEAGSYPTSYIPTQGSVVTRVAEVCSDAGNNQVINSTEGVVYCEIASLVETPETRSVLGISVAGDTDNRVTIEYNAGDTNIIRGQVRTSSLQASIGYTVTSTKDFHKVALVYQLNNVQLWIDGVKRNEDLSADVSSPNTISMAAFLINNTNNFYGKCKGFRIYDTVLTDAELQALTT